MEEIELELTAEGGIRMLHSDLFDIAEFGEPDVTRASHVEYCDGKYVSDNCGVANGTRRGWYVQSAATLDVLKDGFTSRKEALDWEKKYYAPTGAGWDELTGGNKI